MARDRGLLLCIEDKELVDDVKREVRARVRFPSMFCVFIRSMSGIKMLRDSHLVATWHLTRFALPSDSEQHLNLDPLHHRQSHPPS